ncbi:protein FAR1-related sequence 5, partial [Tanacetum coccineum]
LDALCTPESFVTHSNFDTPGGTVYYIPKVSADVLLVKGNVYDSVDDCVVAYMKYAAEAGFVVRRSCQKRLRNGDVKQKYLVCNRKGCPKGIHVDTLDLENSDKQKRNSNLHITRCKARDVFNLVPCTRKFVLNVFDTIHNYELKREEFRHLSKRERQLTYLEQAFIVKAASVNIGATRAHHLLTGIKGSYLPVHASTISSPLNQDGAMRNAIEAEFAGSKHRLCMWHITQKLPAKTAMEKQRHVQERMDHKTIDIVPKLKTFLKIEHSKGLVEGSEVCIIKESPYVYEMPKKKKKPQSVDKGVAERRRWRWTKNLMHAALRNKRNRYGKKNVVVENFANEATLIVDHYVHLLSKDEPRLGAFVEKLKSLKKDVEADFPNPPSKNKIDNLEQLDRNSCSLCGSIDHNKRTCPRSFKVQDEVVVQKEVCQEEVVVQKEICQEEVVQEKVDLAEDEEELVEEDEDLIHE